MRLLLIMNPGSRAGTGKRRWRIWEEGLCAAGAKFDRAQTEGIGHAFELARCATDYDAVVAVGGDGTVSEVLDGVMQSGSPELSMGVLYAGTSPDFCRFHDIPIDPEGALRVLLDGLVREVDVARITYHAACGTELVSHFGCNCNIGMGASVARHSNRWRRFAGDAVGTAAALVRTLMAGRRVDLTLEIDGQAHSLTRVNNLTVAKNPHIASGLKLQLDLRPDDGTLCVLGLHGRSRTGLCTLLPRFYSGSIVEDPNVFLKPCRAVAVSSPDAQEIEFDGDPRGFLPAHIEIAPKALNLIVPRPNTGDCPSWTVPSQWHAGPPVGDSPRRTVPLGLPAAAEAQPHMNERDLILAFAQGFPRSRLQHNEPFTCDAEIVEIGGQLWGLTLDEFTPEEDLFTSDNPEVLGANLATATLSDLQAAGVTPTFFMHAVSLPRQADPGSVAGLAHGIRSVLSQTSCSLCGGDVGTADTWRFTGFAMGPVSDREPPTRILPKQEQTIWVTGQLGDANLAALSGSPTPRFELRLAEAELIRRYGTACIDTSGGFMEAVWSLHTVSPGIRLTIDCRALPLASGVPDLERASGIPAEAALLGGAGEYELLFATPDGLAESARSELASVATLVGTARPDAEPSVIICRADQSTAAMSGPPPCPREAASVTEHVDEVTRMAQELFGSRRP